MINICIESFKLLLHKIKQSENKNAFIIIIIHKDPFLSKGVSNEERDSRDRQLHPSATDSENTSSLENNSNISLLPPRHIHGNYFCWGFAASFSLLRALERRTLKLRCWKLNTVEPLWTVAVARSHVVFTSTVVFFHH